MAYNRRGMEESAKNTVGFGLLCPKISDALAAKSSKFLHCNPNQPATSCHYTSSKQSIDYGLPNKTSSIFKRKRCIALQLVSLEGHQAQRRKKLTLTQSPDRLRLREAACRQEARGSSSVRGPCEPFFAARPSTRSGGRETTGREPRAEPPARKRCAGTHPSV